MEVHYKSILELFMTFRLFFGGLLVGGAIGLMVGAAIVELPADGSGKRKYPQGIALILGLVGGVAAGSTFRTPKSTTSS